MAAGIDRQHMARIGETIEGQRPRDGNYHTAIDQALAEPAGLLAMRIEMNLGGVLVKTGRQLMFDRNHRYARRILTVPVHRDYYRCDLRPDSPRFYPDL